MKSQNGEQDTNKAATFEKKAKEAIKKLDEQIKNLKSLSKTQKPDKPNSQEYETSKQQLKIRQYVLVLTNILFERQKGGVGAVLINAVANPIKTIGTIDFLLELRNDFANELKTTKDFNIRAKINEVLDSKTLGSILITPALWESIKVLTPVFAFLIMKNQEAINNTIKDLTKEPELQTNADVKNEAPPINLNSIISLLKEIMKVDAARDAISSILVSQDIQSGLKEIISGQDFADLIKAKFNLTERPQLAPLLPVVNALFRVSSDFLAQQQALVNSAIALAPKLLAPGFKIGQLDQGELTNIWQIVKILGSDRDTAVIIETALQTPVIQTLLANLLKDRIPAGVDSQQMVSTASPVMQKVLQHLVNATGKISTDDIVAPLYEIIQDVAKNEAGEITAVKALDYAQQILPLVSQLQIGEFIKANTADIQKVIGAVSPALAGSLLSKMNSEKAKGFLETVAKVGLNLSVSFLEPSKLTAIQETIPDLQVLISDDKPTGERSQAAIDAAKMQALFNIADRGIEIISSKVEEKSLLEDLCNSVKEIKEKHQDIVKYLLVGAVAKATNSKISIDADKFLEALSDPKKVEVVIKAYQEIRKKHYFEAGKVLLLEGGNLIRDIIFKIIADILGVIFEEKIIPNFIRRFWGNEQVKNALKTKLEGLKDSTEIKELQLTGSSDDVDLGNYLANYSLRTKFFKGYDLSGLEFKNCKLDGFNLRETIFNKAVILKNVIIKNCDFTGAEFRQGIEITNAQVDLQSLGSLVAAAESTTKIGPINFSGASLILPIKNLTEDELKPFISEFAKEVLQKAVERGIVDVLYHTLQGNNSEVNKETLQKNIESIMDQIDQADLIRLMTRPTLVMHGIAQEIRVKELTADQIKKVQQEIKLGAQVDVVQMQQINRSR